MAAMYEEKAVQVSRVLRYSAIGSGDPATIPSVIWLQGTPLASYDMFSDVLASDKPLNTQGEFTFEVMPVDLQSWELAPPNNVLTTAQRSFGDGRRKVLHCVRPSLPTISESSVSSICGPYRECEVLIFCTDVVRMPSRFIAVTDWKDKVLIESLRYDIDMGPDGGARGPDDLMTGQYACPVAVSQPPTSQVWRDLQPISVFQMLQSAFTKGCGDVTCAGGGSVQWATHDKDCSVKITGAVPMGLKYLFDFAWDFMRSSFVFEDSDFVYVSQDLWPYASDSWFTKCRYHKHKRVPGVIEFTWFDTLPLDTIGRLRFEFECKNRPSTCEQNLEIAGSVLQKFATAASFVAPAEAMFIPVLTTGTQLAKKFKPGQ